MNRTLALALALVACDDNGVPKTGGGEAKTKPAAGVAKALLKTKDGPQKRPVRHEAPAPVALREDEPATYRTTSAHIYWKNLRGQIKELKRLVGSQPKNVLRHRQLGFAQHQMAFLTGRLEGHTAALASLDVAIELGGGSFDNRLARAKTRQALHDFSGALDDLKFVLDKKPKHGKAVELKNSILWSLGRYDEAMPKLRAAAFSPRTTAHAAVAHLLLETGEIEKARKAYAAAVGGFKGVNPASVAWLEVQRGVTYLDAGQWVEAKRLFNAADDRLNEFTLAEEHLAETHALLGDKETAAALYGRVIDRSGDPVFRQALAVVLESQGKQAEADAERAKALQGFEERLKSHPAAVWQEAAEFFFATGDDNRALDLATKNIGLRQDAASLALLARVQAKAGKKAESIATIRKALATPIRTAGLFSAAHEVFTVAGNADEAGDWLAKARALNPKVQKFTVE